MPKNKDLKRRVRTRMKKTGESYTTARAQVTRTRVEDLASTAGVSDDAVQAKTGKTWRQWVRVLDAIDATSMTHRDIARHLSLELDVPGWWAQTVTVGYERIRGLREKGQQRGGGHVVNKSKTYPVPVEELYSAFSSARRKRWLGDAQVRVRKATRLKSMRLVWEDGTPVDAYFWNKGESKSQVQLQHRGLTSSAAAAKTRELWTERLAALGKTLRKA